MQVSFTWRNAALAAGLGVLIVVGLWALLRDDSGPPDVTQGFLPVATNTPLPRSVLEPDTIGPGSTSKSSMVIMVQGLKDRRLMIWPLFEGGEPQEIDRHVGYGPLLPNPTHTQVFYSTDYTAMVLDLDSRRANIIGELDPSTNVTKAQWSPDGAALAYIVTDGDIQIAYYTRVDGSIAAQEMLRAPALLPMDVAWLPDGRPVSISVGVGPVGGLEMRIMAYDPATGDVMVIPSDAWVIQLHAPWRSLDKKIGLYETSSWEQAATHSGCRESTIGQSGPEWYGVAAVGSDELHDVAFKVPYIFLYDPVWLRDGRVIMRGIADENCANTGATGLYIARLGETPRQIIQVTPLYIAGDQKWLRWSLPYAISPDQRFVAWVEHAVSQRTSTIYLTPITEGESQDSTILYQTPLNLTDPNPFYYMDSQLILDFIWLP